MEGQDFTIDGVPSTLEGATDLWTKDKYHFQQWAVEQADGFVTTKRTADGGLTGGFTSPYQTLGNCRVWLLRSRAGQTSTSKAYVR